MSYVELVNHSDYEILNEYPHTIRCKRDGRVINESFDQKGYVRIRLNGKQYRKHRLIAKQFIENDDPDTKTQVDHINHDRSDNRIDNLRWISNRDNCKNKSRHLGVEYTFITELNEYKSFEIDSYRGREFTDYYYNMEDDQFYLKTSDNMYRQLHVNVDRGSEFVLLNDVNHKPFKIYLKSFKRQYNLI